MSARRHSCSLTWIAPAFLYYCAFFVVPAGIFLWLGFWIVQDYAPVPAFSLANYREIAARFFSGSSYGLAVLQTLWVASTATVFAVVFAYSLAAAIVFCTSPRYHRALLVASVLPFWTSYVLRLYAWQVTLADEGALATLLNQAVGVHFPFQISYTHLATRIGLVHYVAPILTFILFVTFKGLDRSFIEVARDLGASRWQTFVRVVLPLSLPGLTLASSFSMLICIGDSLSGSLLGGGAGSSVIGNVPLLSAMILTEYAGSSNLPYTAALAFLLLALMAGVLAVGAYATARVRYEMPEV